MFFNVAHEESDDDNADKKSNEAAYGQNQQLVTGKDKTYMHNVFDQFQQGSADHDGDSQIKGELCRHAAFQPDHQAANDGGTGTGGAGDQGKQLKDAHFKGFPVGNIFDFFYCF